jgi:hypothetical protein
MTCMRIRPRHSVNYFFRYSYMPIFFLKVRKAYIREYLSHMIHIYNDVYNVDYLIYEPNAMVYSIG